MWAMKFKDIRKIDAAWAAGFLEGEGSFIIRKRANHTRYSKISACQKQKEPLIRLVRMFGGGLWLDKSGGYKIWLWNVNGPRARGISLLILPLMSPKRRKQIIKMLKSDNSPVRGSKEFHIKKREAAKRWWKKKKGI